MYSLVTETGERAADEDEDERADSGPFHRGERAVQERVGVADRVARAGAAIRDYMPEQHRAFFASLSYLPLAVVDRSGSPAATILTGPRGFVAALDERSLHIARLPDADDPVRDGLVEGAAVGVLGIELSTRRRNRANGRIADVDRDGFTVAVEQSFGNCPQYIQARELEADAGPAGQQAGATESLARLDDKAAHLIATADTLFVASCAEDGADMSHRGGRPGFVRVDGDVLTVADFAGNRYFNTLGNFLINPMASLLFVDFAKGDLLQVTGPVEIVWGGDEVERFARAERLWRVRVARAWRRHGVLPDGWLFRGFAPTTERTGSW